ncbi:MAG: hypothetical protein NTZ44_00315, partial [Candidatus Nomurabacteria bacterium]|nr:hypothetical protein [Candidatus Nomurabacteria bacterium]
SSTGLGSTAIGADKVTEAMLKAVDAAADEECLTYESTAGDFEWQSCGGGGGSESLQDAYGFGNTITTVDNTNIAFVFPDVASPTSFTIENDDKEALNIQYIFSKATSGTVGNGLLVENTDAGTLTNGIQITETAGAITNGLKFTGTFTDLISAPNISINNAGDILTNGKVVATSSDANALTIGQNGTTNPAFNVDASTASSATGLKITSAAGGGGVALSTISSAADDYLYIDSKGTRPIVIGGTSTGGVTFAGGFSSTGCTISDAGNLSCDGTETISGAIAANGGITSAESHSTTLQIHSELTLSVEQLMLQQISSQISVTQVQTS